MTTLPLPDSDWHPLDEVGHARELRIRGRRDAQLAAAYAREGLAVPAERAAARARRRLAMAQLVECHPFQTDRAYVQVISREPYTWPAEDQS